MMPDSIIREINSLVDTVKEDFSSARPYNANLAGQIDDEFKL